MLPARAPPQPSCGRQAPRLPANPRGDARVGAASARRVVSTCPAARRIAPHASAESADVGGGVDVVEVEVGSVDAAEAARYERIAAKLIDRSRSVVDVDDLSDEDVEGAKAATSALTGLKGLKKVKGRRPPESSPFALQAPDEFELASATPRSRRKLRKISDKDLPKVALIGRPNVGKSAMFNRISGTSLAVVYDEPGVTRDRMYTRAFWGDKEFVMIDTGGLMSDAAKLEADMRESAMRDISAEGLPSAIERQAAAGVMEADVVMVLVDAQAGLQSTDREIVQWLRKAHPSKRLVLVANKCDNQAQADLMASEFWELGLEPLPVSAISGSGTGEMLDALAAALPPPRSLETEDPNEDAPLKVAIVGRPNVGKSSLLNSIVGEERSIVCDMSGTTRDAVDTEVTINGQSFVLIDTAGIRKRARVADTKDGAEPISVERAFRAMRRADVTVMVVDASEGVTQQDFKLSELAAAEGAAVVVVVNKWDVKETRMTEEEFKEEVKAQLRHVNWATVVCTVASTGDGVNKVLKAVQKAGKEHRRRVTTATLNLVITEATQWKSPPSLRGTSRRGKIYYATQAGSSPPSFVFFVNDSKLISDDYKRYMERQLRDNIGFDGTPLRLFWRGKAEREKGVVRVKKA